MKESFFEERGLYYRTNDLREGRPTLVFIHGLSGSSSVWPPYERYFEDSFNVVSMDLRGHGRSRKLFFYSAYSPELIAEDILALLSHLAIRRCIVIGHSFGTLLALSAIKQAPEQFSAVVFLSPTYGASDAWWLPFARVFTSVFAFLSVLLPFNPKPRGHVDYSTYAPTGDWSLRRIIPDIRNTSLRVYLFCTQHIYKLDTEEWWRGLDIPVLIVHGKKDTVIPVTSAEKLHTLLPSSKLVLLENANHILPVNNISEVTAVLSSFLADNDPGKSLKP
ncbi:MAG: Carboxylesterase (Est-1) [Candidatus Kaiserbacteria bacterium GW2011_GWA2_58_9]|uniref:Carboxylesterase (Est-1) n=1 Tax=Candidatus Kaiserbacteria bacterium GW2011_GWA2_58_9 TaxID=1618672 RepID=A0A0G2AVE5_9BACT|nr:MAG: Carboxylesterase (Est-1) [Candidatus Kaiserbacteria bacterium GW2011_GWA2_58_9]